ncbi:hypothetical protein NORO109296_13755 [Nocardiopsis rhodophaea]
MLVSRRDSGRRRAVAEDSAEQRPRHAAPAEGPHRHGRVPARGPGALAVAGRSGRNAAPDAHQRAGDGPGAAAPGGLEAAVAPIPADRQVTSALLLRTGRRVVRA